jgi:hypothetical protein
MTNNETAGRWAASLPQSCGCDWPYDWVSDVNAYDPATGVYQHVATIRQSAVRAWPEAMANVRTMALARDMAEVIHVAAAVIDMSNPDHPSFRDSGADCLDLLFQKQADVLRLRRALGKNLTGAKQAPPHAHGNCHHE